MHTRSSSGVGDFVQQVFDYVFPRQQVGARQAFVGQVACVRRLAEGYQQRVAAQLLLQSAGHLTFRTRDTSYIRWEVEVRCSSKGISSAWQPRHCSRALAAWKFNKREDSELHNKHFAELLWEATMGEEITWSDSHDCWSQSGCARCAEQSTGRRVKSAEMPGLDARK